jgi:hypothetical protein
MRVGASGRFGLELTDAYEFHAYLVTGGTAAMLTDAGAERPPTPWPQPSARWNKRVAAGLLN